MTCSEHHAAFATGAGVTPDAVTFWRNEQGGMQFSLEGETFGLATFGEDPPHSEAEALGRDARRYLIDKAQ